MSLGTGCVLQTEQLEPTEGDRGAPGETGPVGPTGEQGPEGSVDTDRFMVNDGDTGTTGALSAGQGLAVTGVASISRTEAVMPGDPPPDLVTLQGPPDEAWAGVRLNGVFGGTDMDWEMGLRDDGDLVVSLIDTNREDVRIDSDDGTVFITGDLFVGGVMVMPSSRTLKKDIALVKSKEAKKALDGLEPVRFRYKTRPDRERLGFIAEDVPASLATPKRDGVVPLEVVAVLTKVVKDQQKQIDDLEKRLAALERR